MWLCFVLNACEELCTWIANNCTNYFPKMTIANGRCLASKWTGCCSLCSCTFKAESMWMPDTLSSPSNYELTKVSAGLVNTLQSCLHNPQLSNYGISMHIDTLHSNNNNYAYLEKCSSLVGWLDSRALPCFSSTGVPPRSCSTRGEEGSL